ncbi:N-acetylmuramoyl-L-alanine amidase [Flavobacterium sp. CAU 1735]|uniref:N-acetylmuramoyl-L-alanine amidase n=1 Tax=Flavobacterium sp. CAU 1735 TaxID=3140361 RepID=UPI0032605028
MRVLLLAASLSLTLVLLSCSGSKYYVDGPSYKQKAREYAGVYRQVPPENQGLTAVDITDRKMWVGTVNFGIRKPNYVVLHHTAQDSVAQTIRTFLSLKREVSAHYIVGRDGSIVQMANDYFRADHAGVGKWGNDTDLNSSSIGIELDNNGTTDAWPEVQIATLIQLLNYLKSTYNIPQANFIAHADLAPTRKVDPHHFPWKSIADKGFGYWYKEDELVTPPVGFESKIGLKVIGYDVSNLDAAIKAFKIHYIQENEESAELTEHDLSILYAIYRKFL